MGFFDKIKLHPPGSTVQEPPASDPEGAPSVGDEAVPAQRESSTAQRPPTRRPTYPDAGSPS